jgi:hypothetical protein
MWAVVAVVGWTLAIPDGWVHTARLEQAMDLSQDVTFLQQEFPGVTDVDVKLYAPTRATATTRMFVATLTLPKKAPRTRDVLDIDAGMKPSLSGMPQMSRAARWDGPQYIVRAVEGTAATTTTTWAKPGMTRYAPAWELHRNRHYVISESGAIYIMFVLCAGPPENLGACDAASDAAPLAITDAIKPDDDKLGREVVEAAGVLVVAGVLLFALRALFRRRTPAPTPDLAPAPAPPPPARRRPRVDVRFAVASADVTPAGIDARRDDGKTVLVRWSDIFAVVARRLPRAYEGLAFVDVVSGPGTTLRLLSTTRFTGFESPADDAELARRLVALVKSQRPDVKIDKATGEFVDGQPLGQFPDAELFASYDARVP